jgi:hypothetical protein
MNCPDTDRLIDLATGWVSDPTLSAHIDECPSCQEELQLIRMIATARRPETTVSEELVQRTLAAIDFEQDRRGERRGVWIQGIWSAVLGSLTVVLVGLVTSGGDVPSPRALLVYSLLLGTAWGGVAAQDDSVKGIGID